MNQNELEKMLHSSNEVRKLVIGSRECLDNSCATCGYHAICQANSLLHELIGHEADKYNAKGELNDETARATSSETICTQDTKDNIPNT